MISQSLTIVLLSLTCGALFAGLLFALFRRKGGGRNLRIDAVASIEELKAIGVLSVFKAVTKEIVTARDHYRLRDIMRYTKAKITQSRLPTLRDVTAIKTGRLLDEVRATIEAGSLERYTTLVEQFLDDDATSMDMAAAMLKLLMERDFGESAGEERDIFAEEERKSFHREGRPERGDRPDRGPRGGREPRQGFKERRGRDANMARLFFNVGKTMNVGPRDLVGAIAGECGIPGKSIGAIELHDRFSFVDVPVDVADEVVLIMNKSQIRGFRVAVEKAVPKS